MSETLNNTKSKYYVHPSMFLGVNGKDYITFGAGQPDLAPPENVYKDLNKFCSFKYGLVQGEKWLRSSLSKLHNMPEDNFVITNGGSEALQLTMLSQMYNSKNKNFLLTKPYYYSYLPLVKFSGATPKFHNLINGKLDMEKLYDDLKGSKVFLINSPANPTGSVQSVKDLKEVEKMTKELGVTLISDEVYSTLVYDGEHYSPKGDHVVTIQSFSKTFNLCGIRVGYLYSKNKELISDIIEKKTHTSMNTSLIAQHMANEALKAPKSFSTKQYKIWKSRRNMIYQGMQDLGLEVYKPEGAFYVLPKVKEPAKMCHTLFHKHKVISYMGEWFGAEDRIRFSYALNEDRIEEGIKRIGAYLKQNK